MNRPVSTGGKALSRELLLSLGLLLLLVIVLALRSQSTPSDVPYRLDSARPNGLRGLSEWLSEMGYKVGRMNEDAFNLPPGIDLLFVYPGQRRFTIAESEQVRRWVEDGHTLVLVDAGPAERELEKVFDVVSSPAFPPAVGMSRQRQGLFPAAPAALGDVSKAGRTFSELPPRAVPVMTTDGGQITAAVQPVGNGVTWHLSGAHSLVNSDLKDGSAGHIVLALLRAVPAGGAILFDTYHLGGPSQGTGSSEGLTLRDWLYRTPAGWAILFCALVLLAARVLQGTRLGPAVAAREEGRRREAVEHVVALAALQRRARQRQAVARHHKTRLKTTLARRVHLDPGLDDAEFMQRWQELDEAAGPDRADAVRALLAGLDADPDESSLVELVARADAMLSQIAH
jgi:hypothetical protein